MSGRGISHLGGKYVFLSLCNEAVYHLAEQRKAIRRSPFLAEVRGGIEGSSFSLGWY